MVAQAGRYICSVRINNTTNQPQKHTSAMSAITTVLLCSATIIGVIAIMGFEARKSL